MKDGERLSKLDQDFMQELLKFHSKSAEKSADLDGFEVGPHPDFPKTRCFFIVKKDGTKEDFSVSKCIQNLEMQSNNWKSII